MFKKLNSKNAVVFTVITALTGSLLGGVFLYLAKDPSEVSEATVVEEKKEETSEKKTTKKAETKKATSGNFCQNCGAKLADDVKFCPECGKKVK